MDLPGCATGCFLSLVHAGLMYVPFLHLPRSFVFTRCESKALFDVSSTVAQPQLVSNQYWTGVDPLAAYSVATTPDVSADASD
jgi:hypothetical protein